MCGDDFQNEIETAEAKPQPAYSGPIFPPIAPNPNVSENPAVEQMASPNEQSQTDNGEKDTKPPGVTPIPHIPQAGPKRRPVVVRKVQKSPAKHNGTLTIVDGERCERIAEAFEEEVTPKRFALGVGHITGLDAPGFDLVSFDSEEDRESYRNPETRDRVKPLRFIEVKGRGSSSAKIELKGNELKAARKYGDQYYLYRFFEADDNQFYVSILNNPMAAEEAAKATIIEVDLDRATATKRFEFIVELAGADSKD
ncbi:DUF3883 domain-containing protein [Desulfomicrobium norvegicum]